MMLPMLVPAMRIDGDVILLQPLNHPDLRQAERTAPAERKTDAGTAAPALMRQAVGLAAWQLDCC
jgi:predicted thioredoxin/glutaredoxin